MEVHKMRYFLLMGGLALSIGLAFPMNAKQKKGFDAPPIAQQSVVEVELPELGICLVESCKRSPSKAKGLDCVGRMKATNYPFQFTYFFPTSKHLPMVYLEEIGWDGEGFNSEEYESVNRLDQKLKKVTVPRKKKK